MGLGLGFEKVSNDFLFTFVVFYGSIYGLWSLSRYWHRVRVWLWKVSNDFESYWLFCYSYIAFEVFSVRHLFDFEDYSAISILFLCFWPIYWPRRLFLLTFEIQAFHLLHYFSWHTCSLRWPSQNDLPSSSSMIKKEKKSNNNVEQIFRTRA